MIRKRLEGGDCVKFPLFYLHNKKKYTTFAVQFLKGNSSEGVYIFPPPEITCIIKTDVRNCRNSRSTIQS